MNSNQTPATPKSARLSLHVKPGSAPSGTIQAGTDLSLNPSHLVIRRILVPIDFSEASDKALRYARKFLEQFGAEITLLHVIQPMAYPSDFGYPPPVVDTVDEALRVQVTSRLKNFANQSDPPMQTLIRVGQPYHEITTVAQELNADLIIIPTHGRTGLKHVLLGSTAERVVRYAPCPVLTVRERAHDFA